jgi:hypothetical protein
VGIAAAAEASVGRAEACSASGASPQSSEEARPKPEDSEILVHAGIPVAARKLAEAVFGAGKVRNASADSSFDTLELISSADLTKADLDTLLEGVLDALEFSVLRVDDEVVLLDWRFDPLPPDRELVGRATRYLDRSELEETRLHPARFFEVEIRHMRARQLAGTLAAGVFGGGRPSVSAGPGDADVLTISGPGRSVGVLADLLLDAGGSLPELERVTESSSRPLWPLRIPQATGYVAKPAEDPGPGSFASWAMAYHTASEVILIADAMVWRGAETAGVGWPAEGMAVPAGVHSAFGNSIGAARLMLVDVSMGGRLAMVLAEANFLLPRVGLPRASVIDALELDLVAHRFPACCIAVVVRVAKRPARAVEMDLRDEPLDPALLSVLTLTDFSIAVIGRAREVGECVSKIRDLDRQ